MTRTSTVQALVRRTHEERVLAVLRECSGLSRAQISARVGLSRTTLSEITGDLLARGAIVVVDTDAERRTGSGRRAELLALDPASGQHLGIDLGHSRVRAVIADAAHDVVATGHASYDAGMPWQQQVECALALVETLGVERGLHLRALQGVAVGVAGPDTSVRHAVQAAFAARFDCPVLVDNNTRYAALAEALAEAGTGEAVGELVYLRISEGIGGGLVISGRLVPGGRGAAGEFGHIRVDTGPGALDCRCGKTGCLETVASVPSLLQRAGVDSLDALLAARDAADPAALRAIADAGEAVGTVLADAALIISPDQIVVGGRAVQVLPELVEHVATRVAAELAAVGSGPPVIRAALLDDEDGARGAVAALHQRTSLLTGYLDPLTAAAAGGTFARPDALGRLGA